jgi:2-amino-4-hydroxy-6-hydroxymethyldihydropteridine diphosphokinase
VYRTAPRDVTDQPEFLNAVASLQTTLSPKALAASLQGIEEKLKKTIDLDLLLYDQEIIHTDELTVPHPRMHERRFVIQPLLDLHAGNILHPQQHKTLSSFLPDVQEQHCDKTSIVLP